MTEIDTSRHTLTSTRISIALDLENMPAQPTKYGREALIATGALVMFKVDETGAVRWNRMELTGWRPNKSGEPSKLPNSDSYSDWTSSRNPNPDPYQGVPDTYVAVIKTATAIVEGMLQ